MLVLFSGGGHGKCTCLSFLAASENSALPIFAAAGEDTLFSFSQLLLKKGNDFLSFAADKQNALF